jgi:hypothetical protein
MAGNVVVGTFSYRHEAELFRSILESRGIASIVGADDEGALHPGLGFSRGVHLFVTAEDAARASDILDEHEDQTTIGADAEPGPNEPSR